MAERQADLDGLFKKMRMDRIVIRTDEGYIEPLIRFFRNRNRLR